MWESFSIEGLPVPAARPRVTTRGHAYYPKAHTERAGFLNSYLSKIVGETVKAPVEIRILSVMPRYKTSDYPTSRADVDNLSKLPMDCMTKVGFWTDDNLVVSLMSLKRFCREGEQPHTVIKFRPIQGSVEDNVDALFNV